MKKITFLLITIIGLFTIYSCETDRDNPVINTNMVTPPAITVPVDGSNFVLIKDSADSDMTTFEWTIADYGVENLPDITYTFQMDIADSNFMNIITLQRSTDLKYTMNVGNMNDKLTDMEFPPDTAVDVAFRVMASQSANMEDVYSNVVALSITPYSTIIVGVPSFYLYGGSTEAGWDNSAAIEMTIIDEDFYVSVETLDPAGDGMKFITFLGQDIPQWGTDANGTNEGGLLVYQETEADPVPVNIPTPIETGDHRIEVYTGDAAHYVIIKYPDNLFLLGDATSAGWDNAAAIPFTKEAPGKFSIIHTLSGSGYYKFTGVLGEWAPMFGTDAEGTGMEGNLVYRPTEDVTDPPAIESPDAGTYKIEINLITLKYVLTAQ